MISLGLYDSLHDPHLECPNCFAHPGDMQTKDMECLLGRYEVIYFLKRKKTKLRPAYTNARWIDSYNSCQECNIWLEVRYRVGMTGFVSGPGKITCDLGDQPLG